MAFRQMDRQWKQTHSSFFYESVLQYLREGSVQLWSLYIAAELKHSERSNKMLARSCFEWHNKWSLPFYDFLLQTLYLFFLLYPPFKRPTTIPALSVLQPPFSSISVFPISLVAAHPSHSPDSLTLHTEVPPDFHVLILLAPLPFVSSSSTGTLFPSCDFGPSNGGVCCGWLGNTYMFLARLLLSNFG